MSKSRKTIRSNETRKPQPGDPGYIGYGHPPAKTRFKKGQCGNRNGRPRGSKNYSTVMRELLQTRVKINKDGKQKSVNLVEATGLNLAKKALGGDFRSIQEILDIARTHEASADNAARGTSVGGDAALAVFVDRIRSGAYGEPDAPEVEDPEKGEEK